MEGKEKIIWNKIYSWIEIWNSLLIKYPKNIDLINLRFLIKLIKNENNENGLRNQDNNKLLTKRLKKSLNENIVKNEYIHEINKLCEFLKNKETNLVSVSLNDLENKLNKSFFSLNFEELKSLILSEDDLNEDTLKKIKYISKNLIIEYLNKGFEIKSIMKFPYNCFHKAQYYDKTYISYFPHNIDECQFIIDGIYDNNSYNKYVESLNKSLTLDLRFKRLNEYFNQEKKESFMILKVEGIKFNNKFKYNNIEIFSQHKDLKLKFRTSEHIDLNDKMDDSKGIYFKVKVLSFDENDGINDARNKIENLINYTFIYYTNPEENYYIYNENFYMLNLEGIVIAQSSYLKNSYHGYVELSSFFNSENNKKPFVKKIESFLSSKKEEDLKLLYTFRYLKEGKLSKDYSNKLLNLWIGLENLFKEDLLVDKNSISKIIEIIPKLKIKYCFLEKTQEYYQFLYSQINSWRENDLDESGLILFDNVLKTQIREDFNSKLPRRDKGIILKDFISFIKELKSKTDDVFHTSKINNIEKILDDSNERKKYFNDVKIKLEEDLQLIYMYRNLIVHTAHGDKILIEYFYNRLLKIINNFFPEILGLYIEKNVSFKKCLINKYYESNLFLKKINENEYVDLLN